MTHTASRGIFRELLIQLPWLAVAYLAFGAFANGQEIVAVCAEWCNPCKQMEPVLGEVEGSGCKVRRVDFDQHRQWAEQNGVTRLPTFIALDASGREVGRHAGLTSAGRLMELVGHEPPLVPVQSSLPQMYGISYLPQEPQQPWSEKRVVKIRNKQPDGYAYVTGSVVNYGGDSSYVVTCAHGIGDPGDPCLVTFNDGVTLDIAEVVQVDRFNDCSVLKLKGGPRPDYFEMAESDAPAGARIFGGGFMEGERWGGGYETVSYEEDIAQGNEKRVVGRFGGEAFQGQSGGPVVSMDSKLCGVIHSTNSQGTYYCRIVCVRSLFGRMRGGVIVIPATPNPAPNYGMTQPMPAPGAEAAPPASQNPPPVVNNVNITEITNQVLIQIRQEIASGQLNCGNLTAEQVLAKVQPIYIRVQDARGPEYSTEYQEVRLGTQKQYVTLPFGPRN